METLRFGENDLSANRQGKLSEAQKALLASRLKALPIMGLLMASVPLSFVVMSLITLASAGEWSQPSDPAALGLVIVILIVALLLGLAPLFLTLRSWRMQRAALEQGVVLSAEGTVEIETAGRRCLVIVSDDSGHETAFTVSRRVETAFDGCDRFRIYYTAMPRRIVAAECING